MTTLQFCTSLWKTLRAKHTVSSCKWLISHACLAPVLEPKTWQPLNWACKPKLDASVVTTYYLLETCPITAFLIKGWHCLEQQCSACMNSWRADCMCPTVKYVHIVTFAWLSPFAITSITLCSRMLCVSVYNRWVLEVTHGGSTTIEVRWPPWKTGSIRKFQNNPY